MCEENLGNLLSVKCLEIKMVETRIVGQTNKKEHGESDTHHGIRSDL